MSLQINLYAGKSAIRSTRNIKAEQYITRNFNVKGDLLSVYLTT
jgi:hypothetical protein